jgi:hypothetical protein
MSPISLPVEIRCPERVMTGPANHQRVPRSGRRAVPDPESHPEPDPPGSPPPGLPAVADHAADPAAVDAALDDLVAEAEAATRSDELGPTSGPGTRGSDLSTIRARSI